MGGKKKPQPGEHPAASPTHPVAPPSPHEDNKASPAAPAPGEATNITTLLQWMMARDEEQRRKEAAREEERRREEAERRKEEAERRREEADRRGEEAARFERLVQSLAIQQRPLTDPTTEVQSTSTTVTPSTQTAASSDSTPKASVETPSALTSDVTFQTFREWRRQWEDYATMVDLFSLPQAKQLIQLRMCLSKETQRVLEHTLLVPPESTLPVKEILDKLQEHIKGNSNETLRKQAFSNCKQAEGETFSDFYVRLKSLAEEVDLCKAHDTTCKEAWIKHGILMGVRDEKLVQKLISMDASCSLQDAVKECRAYEATKSTTSALRTQTAVRAVSQYKKGKKGASMAKTTARTSTPPPKNSCSNCGKQHAPQACPAADATCHGCGRKGHWAHTAKCSASGTMCSVCNRYGHLTKLCSTETKPKGQKGRGKPKSGGQPKPTSKPALNVIRSQSPDSSPCSGQQRASYIRRLESGSRPLPRPSPTIQVTITCGEVSGSIEAIPDTGADTTVIGPQHLESLGLTKRHLNPPPKQVYYNADGSKMPPAVGSFQANLTYGNRSHNGWIDVQSSLTTPLLSWEHCKELGVVPKDFPRQITDARCTTNRVCGPGSDTPDGVAPCISEVPTDPAPPPAKPSTLPFSTKTSPEAAREHFLKKYSDVLVRKEDIQAAPLKMMSGPPMRIHLKDDAQPFAIHTPRLIPLAFQEPVRMELDSMVAQGVIAPTGDDPSPWCHPMVAVAKPNGGIRITTDLSKLNKQVSRPTHPSPTPFAAIRSVTPKARFFSTVDALCGYWQIPLAEEDQHLTTFITPYGRFRYLRGPMGFSATGDAFCLRGDKALQGVMNCVKVVDDILLYDEDYLTHLQRLDNVLSKCRTYGITLNADKFVLAAPTVTFCGYQLSKDGVAADPEKVRAIAEFATPANLTDLRSFMGLVNQLADFSTEISTAAAPLRPLMSPKRTFTWTPDHDQAFKKVKEALSSPPVLATFDPTLPSVLQTDASRLYGVGYALLQDHGGGQLRLVQCGSRFLTDPETRYATIELELLAVVWAMLKCKFYLFGLQHFDLVTDHRPLVPILNHYSLDAIENPRLQRLKEKISAFNFTATWRAGKELCIPDALSRSPTSRPTPEDELLSSETACSVRSVVTLQAVESLTRPEAAEQEDLALEELQQAARDDPAYTELLKCTRQGFPSDRYDLHNTVRPYWKLREDLYSDGDLVLYGARVVVPAALRRRVLTRLHDSHRGAEATKRRARQAVYWPGIDSDIVNTVRACEPCQVMQPSQQQEPLLCDDHPTRPFESVSADFFSAAGKSFLVYTDRLSGWPAVVPCGSDTTSAATIRHFRHLFRDLGVPVRLRTDGGPQFTSREFNRFLERWGVRHAITTPYYPQSNGHAEAAVKNVKHLILKVAPSGNIDCEAFDRGLLELRNTPNHTGRSPAQILYGRPLRSCIPAHATAFAKEWQARAESCDRRAATRAQDARTRYDERARPLRPLEIGAEVRVQDPGTKRWDKLGTVMGVGKSRDYQIRLPSGRVWWRNRRFLRPTMSPVDPTPEPGLPTPEPDPSSPAPARRSERIKARQTAQDL